MYALLDNLPGNELDVGVVLQKHKRTPVSTQRVKRAQRHSTLDSTGPVILHGQVEILWQRAENVKQFELLTQCPQSIIRL